MNEKSCGAIIIYNNKVLVIKQKQGFYGFPKGHVIEGESEIETALREVKEEVNLDVVIDESKRYSINYITDKNINKTVVFFLAHPISFDLKIQEEELKKAQWVDIEDVSSILTHQDLRVLFINICNDMKQELKESIEKNYNLDIVDITKSSESTVKNVYIISTKNKKYVIDLPYSEAIQAYLAAQRELDKALELLLKELEENKEYLYEVLRKGSENARKVAAQTLSEVREAMGIEYFKGIEKATEVEVLTLSEEREVKGI